MTPFLFRLRVLLVLLVACITMPATASEPADADIERLLKASRAESMLEQMLPQMEALQQEQFNRLVQGKDLTDAQKAELGQIQEKTAEIVRKALSWDEMRPLYIDVYKKSFSRADIQATTKFYESRAGQSLLNKTPVLMQNLMQAVQAKMVPLFEELEKEIRSASGEELPAPSAIDETDANPTDDTP